MHKYALTFAALWILFATTTTTTIDAVQIPNPHTSKQSALAAEPKSAGTAGLSINAETTAKQANAGKTELSSERWKHRIPSLRRYCITTIQSARARL